MEKEDLDIISNLPRNVKDTILTCLPLRAAVRTSILSKKWRYSWTTIPKLVFDNTIYEVSWDKQLLLRHKLLSFINSIMLFHQGIIHKFSLSHYALKPCPEIDHLIIFLSKKGMHEFNLELWNGKLYKLPSSFFSCQELTHLDLRSCAFSPPPAFKGFPNLISLKFDSVTFNTHQFENFISNCSQLERLTLSSYRKFHCINIRAATLKFLHFIGTCISVMFPFHQPITIVDMDLKEGKGCRFFEFFGRMPSLDELISNCELLQGLAEGGVPKKLPYSINLKILVLSDIYFDALEQVSCLYALISSSPNIQRIQILVRYKTGADATPVLEFLNALDYSDIILDKLQEVGLSHVSGTEPELKFIELLLAKSPMLDTMLIIRPTFKVDHVKLLTKLTRFQRTSPMAKILYE